MVCVCALLADPSNKADGIVLSYSLLASFLLRPLPRLSSSCLLTQRSRPGCRIHLTAGLDCGAGARSLRDAVLGCSCVCLGCLYCPAVCLCVLFVDIVCRCCLCLVLSCLYCIKVCLCVLCVCIMSLLSVYCPVLSVLSYGLCVLCVCIVCRCSLSCFVCLYCIN